MHFGTDRSIGRSGIPGAPTVAVAAPDHAVALRHQLALSPLEGNSLVLPPRPR